MILRHTTTNVRIMLDWLRSCEDESRIAPSYSEIQARFDFESLEEARTLIAGLSDGGLIKIRPAGDDRFSFLVRNVPVRSPATPRFSGSRDVADDDDVDEERIERTVARIRAAVGKPRRAKRVAMQPVAAAARVVAPQPAPKPTPTPAPIRMPEAANAAVMTFRCGHPRSAENSAPAGTCRRGQPAVRCRQCHAALQTKLYHQRPKTAEKVASIAARAIPKRTVSAYVPTTIIEQLAAEAKALGQSPASYLRGVIEQRHATKAQHPRIRGEVTRAWQQDGRPFGEFIAALIDLGLAAHLAGRAGQ